ncbi:MAG: glycoside hydrolase family 127 protein [Propionibacteriaceae bacterium]|nr:glycoside hydrolase family 127 protein [Propionibacteriaceae bacterium]
MTPRRPTDGPVSPIATEQLKFQPLPFTGAAITGGWWSSWQHDNRKVTTPHAFSWLERDGSIDNLRRLAPDADGQPARRGLWFTDSDVYKALEGVSWDLAREPSDDLTKLVSDCAEVIGRAQQADGYLNSFVQAGLDVRWDNLVKSHELYCIGHLIQSAIAHHRATGSEQLLSIAVAAADCVVRDFGHNARQDTDGHEEIETALVELYRETGNRDYLEVAQQLLEVRGHGVLGGDGHFDSSYFQDGVPVREQDQVVGHAVRAVYLLAGVVDVYLETGEQALLDAAIAQWEDMTYRKTYLNGALGSRFIGEAFGDAYELPPDLVYGETCATIGNIMLSWRLLLATGERRFADTIERALYNLFAASTSLSRDAFFYNNPAQRRTPQPAAPTDARPSRADAPGTRPAWFECACCPPNIMRMIASLQAYVATSDASGVQIQQYAPSTISVPFGSGTIGLDVATRYPIDGQVDLTVTETPTEPWTLALRIPDWAESFTLQANSERVEAPPTEAGYARLERVWQAGDTVRLRLPMEPRLTVTHPAADALRGTVAIERGPVVYCLESPDQPDGTSLNHVALLVDEPLTEELHEDFLKTPTVVVTAHGLQRSDAAWQGTGWMPLNEQPEGEGTEVGLVAIPYYLWANRGPSAMRIFIPARRASRQ